MAEQAAVTVGFPVCIWGIQEMRRLNLYYRLHPFFFLALHPALGLHLL
jgi:hypothetical protein